MPRIKIAGWPRWAVWLVPLGATATAYILAYLACRYGLDAPLVPERIPYDFAILASLSYLLFAVSRRLWAYLALLFLLIGALYIGSAFKIAYLGRPIMPDDIYSIGALFRILGGWGWFVVAVPLALIFGLFAFNLRLQGKLRKAALSALIVIPTGATVESLPLYQAMDQFWGNTPWDQRENFLWRGGTVHILQESLRAFALRQDPPKSDEVAAALARRLDAAGAK
jgi:phosphoglycerol transferase MdoB-like AlkP superfamily enzyme